MSDGVPSGPSQSGQRMTVEVPVCPGLDTSGLPHLVQTRGVSFRLTGKAPR